MIRFSKEKYYAWCERRGFYALTDWPQICDGKQVIDGAIGCYGIPVPAWTVDDKKPVHVKVRRKNENLL